MIVNQQITDYIHALEPELKEHFRTMRKYAKEHFVPIIKLETESFLEITVAMQQPKKILEIGTAIGYSSLLMSQWIHKDSTITTIERSPEMIQIAKRNIGTYGKEGQITLLEGDAVDILKNLAEKGNQYDFIFMDAAKGQYITFLEPCLKMLTKKGVIFSDNVLQDGEVANSRYGISRRNRTIHSRMREYLWELKHNETLFTSIIPIGDGVALSYRK